ncbi:hypothetical protein [Streptomyces sp. NBC_00211]|uniref:hypothetical protein n=1 Tax=Streptomyces sp. NBC_00211 TaxID=2975683 RepID=UPI00324DE950
MSETENKESPTGPSLKSGADRIREAAKWLIVSFAAVGVTLFGGLQLADVGQLSADQPARWVPAILGIILGLIGLAVAIHAASSVVTESYASLGWLETADAASIKREIETDASLLGGFENVADLRSAIATAQARRKGAYEARYAPPPADESDSNHETRIAAADAELVSASYWLQSLSQVEQRALQVASFRRTSVAYLNARGKMFWGAALTALGISLFAWGANPPEKPEAVMAEQILPPSPSNVRVIVTNQSGIKVQASQDVTLSKALGKDCALSKIDAIALGATGDTYYLVSLKTDRCNPVYFTIDPSQGKVVPREAEKDESKSDQ